MKNSKKIVVTAMIALFTLNSVALATYKEELFEVQAIAYPNHEDEYGDTLSIEQVLIEESQGQNDQVAEHPIDTNAQGDSLDTQGHIEAKDEDVQVKAVADVEKEQGDNTNFAQLKEKIYELNDVFDANPSMGNLDSYLDLFFSEEFKLAHYEEQELISQYGGLEEYFLQTGKMTTSTFLFQSFQVLLSGINNKYADISDSWARNELKLYYYKAMMERVQDKDDLFKEIVYYNIANQMFYSNFKEAFPQEADFIVKIRPELKPDELPNLDGGALDDLLRIIEKEELFAIPDKTIVFEDEDERFDDGIHEMTPPPAIGHPPFDPGTHFNDNYWDGEQNISIGHGQVREKQTYLYLSYLHGGRRLNLLEQLESEDTMSYENIKALFKHLSVRLKGQFIEDVDKFMALIDGEIYVFEDGEDSFSMLELSEKLEQHGVELVTREVVR